MTTTVSFVEGAQIPLQAAMDFLQRGTEPESIQEQMIWNNRHAWSEMISAIYRPLDELFIKNLAFMLTEEMDGCATDYRQIDNHVIAAMNTEPYDVPPAYCLPERMGQYYEFLRFGDMHPLIKASAAQAYLLVMRPFPEGNERLSRMISSAVLLRSGYDFFREISIMNLKKIRRLMDKYGLMCPVRKANPYRRMAKALKTSNVAQYLLDRKFREFGPRMVLLTDITYIPYNGTFAFLSTILDAFTKQILSYVLSDSLEVDFVLETVNQLIEKHGISLKADTLINSDQGSHYTSYSFIQLIKDKGLRQSMSHRGNCWDNAPQESFFGHMKDHIMDKIATCTEFSQVKSEVDDYMDYYNKERYQWELAKLSPNEFYQFVTTKVYPIKVKNPPSAESFLNVKPADAQNPLDNVD